MMLNDIERYWTISKDVEQYRKMLNDFKRCWTISKDVEQYRKTLNDIERCWTISKDVEQYWNMLNDNERCWTISKDFEWNRTISRGIKKYSKGNSSKQWTQVFENCCVFVGLQRLHNLWYVFRQSKARPLFFLALAPNFVCYQRLFIAQKCIILCLHSLVGLRPMLHLWNGFILSSVGKARRIANQ